MTLQKNRQVWIPGVQGAARIPGALGTGPLAGQSTNARGAARLPGPLGIGPSILLMDSTVTKLAPKTLTMPAPTQDRTKHVHVVTWDLGAASPRTTDVIQGGLANCPVASILAAMANTPRGAAQISKAVREHSANVVTDLAGVMQYLDDDLDWVDRPKGSLSSNRYFSVDLPGIKQEVSDVFYTDQADRGWDLVYIGFQGIRRDKGIKPVLWPSVIEKAYAAQLGGYQKLDALNDPVVAWKALVGPASTLVQVKDLKDSDITRLVQAASGVPTIATTRDDRSAPDNKTVEHDSGGLLEGWHGYAVTGLAGSQIALYDPFGKPVKVSLAQFKKFFTTIVYGGL
jgi:hypothetical protein